MATVFSFENLDCWKQGRKIRKDISALVNKFPNSEKYMLGDQMIRASRSITNNLAEGFGRFHHQENIQFCRLSRGSLFELLDHVLIASEKSYITENEVMNFRKEYETELRLLNGHIAYLKKAKSQNRINNPIDEPELVYQTNFSVSSNLITNNSITNND